MLYTIHVEIHNIIWDIRHIIGLSVNVVFQNFTYLFLFCSGETAAHNSNSGIKAAREIRRTRARPKDSFSPHCIPSIMTTTHQESFGWVLYTLLQQSTVDTSREFITTRQGFRKVQVSTTSSAGSCLHINIPSIERENLSNLNIAKDQCQYILFKFSD